MAIQRTLSIIKPDATRRNLIGKINAKIEESGLRIVAQKMILMSKSNAADFYKVHEGKSFFEDLCNNITFGRVVVQVLEGDLAVEKYRTLMGATNPINAREGTIRHEFAESIDFNSVHGSDSEENAEKEIKFFFSEIEIFS